MDGQQMIINILTGVIFTYKINPLHLTHPQDCPPPGAYEVQKAFEKSQLRTERAKPRTEDANRKHGSFLSAASRFAPPRDVLKTSRADPENPG
ncbi:hypothetical protein KUTeg_003965 [Tegillarca granosa]|uniref:Uncharacterized protein n=1 Tax=Tegillarca granosa TaxID=220873 RepID=A0ABQ9FNJ2_TEGGR|nr:hypothetical protein KUTeg_003965 [Tegillarca granosa]